jgi:NitT/TauT family transport system permease protein
MGLFMPVRNIFQPLIAAIYPLPKIASCRHPAGIRSGRDVQIRHRCDRRVFPHGDQRHGGRDQHPEHLFRRSEEPQGVALEDLCHGRVSRGARGIFVGLRSASGPRSFFLVAAEFVGANEGIGYRLWWSWTVFWVNNMYVGFAVIAVLGFLLNFIVDYCERRWLPWQGR